MLLELYGAAEFDVITPSDLHRHDGSDLILVNYFEQNENPRLRHWNKFGGLGIG